MLHYETIPVTPFQQNCSIVWCDQTQLAAVIDPGGELNVLLNVVKRLGVTLSQIWITHAHVDHAAATADLAERLGLPIIGPHDCMPNHKNERRCASHGAQAPAAQGMSACS